MVNWRLITYITLYIGKIHYFIMQTVYLMWSHLLISWRNEHDKTLLVFYNLTYYAICHGWFKYISNLKLLLV